jgi:(2Fe-2S) ferredoxin
MNQHGPNKIRVSASGCLGRCKLGPCVVIYPENKWFTYQNRSDVDRIIGYCLGETASPQDLEILDERP